MALYYPYNGPDYKPDDALLFRTHFLTGGYKRLLILFMIKNTPDIPIFYGG